jgi:hypothetical protein
LTNNNIQPTPLAPHEKRACWHDLKKEGWRAISARNKLHDWYYVRPNCDPSNTNSKLNEDYFLNEGDALKASFKDRYAKKD